MPKKQPDRLINDRSHFRNEDEYKRNLSKTRVCLCCCLCFIIVLAVIVAVMFVKKGHKEISFPIKHKDLVPKFHELPLSKSVPRNLTEFIHLNEKLCHEVTNKQTTETINNPSHIYIVKGEYNITVEQACAIESILRLFPDKTIYLIDFNKRENKGYTRSSSPPNYLGFLLYLYKDRLELMIADKLEFFKNTPLQNISQKDKDFEFFVMLVTAYKYGGFVAAPEMVMTSREFIECFPEETIVEPFSIFASKKCDDFLYYLMQSFSFCASQNTTREEILTKSIQLYNENQISAKKTARRLRTNEVCTDAKDSGSFLKLKSFKDEETKWICDLAGFCKQVVQEFLGIKMNKIEVEEETSKIKSRIKENGMKTCETITAGNSNAKY